MNIVEAVKLYKPGMILRRTSWGNKNFILRFRDEGNAESVEVHTIDIPHYSHINTVLGIDGLSANDWEIYSPIKGTDEVITVFGRKYEKVG